jgi:hypothetical protein
MSPLAQFVAYFLAASAITSLVQCMVREGRPGIIVRESLRFFLLVVLAIIAFSAVVYGLEWAFIR